MLRPEVIEVLEVMASREFAGKQRVRGLLAERIIEEWARGQVTAGFDFD